MCLHHRVRRWYLLFRCLGQPAKHTHFSSSPLTNTRSLTRTVLHRYLVHHCGGQPAKLADPRSRQIQVMTGFITQAFTGVLMGMIKSGVWSKVAPDARKNTAVFLLSGYLNRVCVMPRICHL